MICCQTSEVVFECSFGSLNVVYVYIDKVHITMTYKKHIRILFMEHSYDRRRCYEPHVLSPLRVHRISSTDNTLNPLIYSNMYVFCDVSKSHLQYYYSPCVFVCSQSSIILINILPSISTTNSLFRFCFLQIICHEKTT